jgi:hypothetical protein
LHYISLLQFIHLLKSPFFFLLKCIFDSSLNKTF